MSLKSSYALTRSVSVKVLLILAVFFLYSKIPWEWGLMDDPTRVLTLTANVNHLGFFDGIYQTFLQCLPEDRSWGIFRPSWWIYYVTAYLLPVRWAYTSRFITVICTVWALIYFSRKNLGLSGGNAIALALVAMASPVFYVGLGLFSIQETPGLLLILLALICLTKTKKSIISNLFGILLLLAAVFFKAPFVWFAFCFTGYLFFQKRFMTSVLLFLVMAVSLAILISWSRNGGYTAKIYHPNLSTAFHSFLAFFQPFKYPLFLMVLYTFLNPTKEEPNNGKLNLIGLTLLFGGGLYLGTLLMWPASAYYFGPPVFMISIGLFLRLLSNQHLLEQFRVRVFNYNPQQRNLIFNLLSVLLVCFIVIRQSVYIYRVNDGVVRLRDWALSKRNETLNICTTGYEAAVTFPKLLRIRTDEPINLKFDYIQDGADLNPCDYFFSREEDALMDKLLGENKITLLGESSKMIRIFRKI